MSNRPNPKGNRKPVRKPAAPGASTQSRWVLYSVLAVLALVAVIAVVAVAAGGGGSDDSKTSGGRPVKFQTAPDLTVDGTSLPDFVSPTRDPAVGMAAPTLQSVDFTGKPMQVGGATGKPYALAFLAHWCPHCQAEVPRLVELAKGKQIAGVDVIGVPTGTTNQAPNYPPSAWLAREHWPFPVLLDTAKAKAARAYGLTSYPYFVFVDGSGNVVGRMSGEVEPDQLEAIFGALAKGAPLPITSDGASSSR